MVARRSERLSFNKDGVYKVGEISAPRATVTIQWDGTTEDKILFEKTIAFLEELEANNQIISFSVK